MRLTLSCRWFDLAVNIDQPQPPPHHPADEMPRYDSRSTVASSAERAQPTHIGFAAPWEPPNERTDRDR